MRLGSGQGAPWDPAKPWGAGQQAPLTPDYQALFEANLRDQAAGGQGSDPSFRCIPTGMPRVMIAVQPMEIVVSPDTTYVMLELFGTLRRIFTDGRDWPKDIEPSFAGYSIGKWEDADGDGRFDTLVAETRAIKGPHSYEFERHSLPPGWPRDHSRAHLLRQNEPECPAQRDHLDRQRADAALDREAQLSPGAGQGADLVGIRLLREQPACSDRIGKLCHRR